MTADPTLAAGSRVLIVCQKGHLVAHATVLQRCEAMCHCGGPLFLCRFDDGPEQGMRANICGDALRRPN